MMTNELHDLENRLIVRYLETASGEGDPRKAVDAAQRTPEMVREMILAYAQTASGETDPELVQYIIDANISYLLGS